MFLKNHRYIFLDQNLEERELLQVMAHELGHAILHKKQNCYFIRHKTLLLNSKTEQEANIFAAELLIDDGIILEHPEYTNSQLARLLGYEERLIEWWMQNNNK
jgi:Zn-dependent peptidase ImmA (M78 family)